MIRISARRNPKPEHIAGKLMDLVKADGTTMRIRAEGGLALLWFENSEFPVVIREGDYVDIEIVQLP